MSEGMPNSLQPLAKVVMMPLPSSLLSLVVGQYLAKLEMVQSLQARQVAQNRM